jgi:hypothetical protein
MYHLPRLCTFVVRNRPPARTAPASPVAIQRAWDAWNRNGMWEKPTCPTDATVRAPADRCRSPLISDTSALVGGEGVHRERGPRHRAPPDGRGRSAAEWCAQAPGPTTGALVSIPNCARLSAQVVSRRQRSRRQRSRRQRSRRQRFMNGMGIAHDLLSQRALIRRKPGFGRTLTGGVAREHGSERERTGANGSDSVRVSSQSGTTKPSQAKRRKRRKPSQAKPGQDTAPASAPLRPTNFALPISPYQSSVRRCQTVCRFRSTGSRAGSRAPTTRGRPIVCAPRLGAGRCIMESRRVEAQGRHQGYRLVDRRAQWSPSSSMR